jgi:Protein of unknown function (DUF2786)
VVLRPAPTRPDVRLLRAASRALYRAAFSRALDGIVLDRPTLARTQAALAPLLRGELGARPYVVDLAVDAALREAAFDQLTHGWTVTELRDVARPRLDAQALRYLVDVLGATAQWCAASEWFPELEDIGGGIWWTVGEPHARQWAQRHAVQPARMLEIAVDVLGLLIALPGTGDARPETPAAPELRAGHVVQESRVVARIDALYAKAARSVFPEEAAAYAAKAQDLLVRHAGLSAQLLTPGRRPRPGRLAAVTALRSA